MKYKYLMLWNSNSQLQLEGKKVTDCWCIVAAGNTPEHAQQNAQYRSPFIDYSDTRRYKVIEDTPENRSAHGNPRQI